MAAEAAFSVRLGLASSGVAYASCSSDKRRRCSPGGMAGSRHASEAKAALAGSLVGQPPLKVRAHAVLQGEGDAPLLSRLLGGFQVESTGEQWLVFYDQGTVTAADYAAMAAEATARGVAVGTVEFLDKFDPSKVIARRRRFVLSILQQVFCALRFMHDRGFLHQSLGPASVVLSTTDEIDAGTMRARLRDLSFAVDIRDETMLASGTREDGDGSSNNSRDDGGTSPPDPVQEWASRDLWRRAAMASGSSGRDGSSDSLTMGGIPFQSSLSGGVGGATPLTARLARRAYGVADDVYAAGLLLLYLAFVPFAEPGSVDGPSLQRLVEGTFRLDLSQLRDYCDADPRWAQAVRFLDAGGKPREDGQPGGEGSGWHLLSLMMNANYRERPTMEAVLQHPWLWG
eukprot:jgi/Mesvir1/9614/Mv17240-RA.2